MFRHTLAIFRDVVNNEIISDISC